MRVPLTDVSGFGWYIFPPVDFAHFGSHEGWFSIDANSRLGSICAITPASTARTPPG